MVDRFSSREEPEFDRVAYEQGYECRIVANCEKYEDATRNNPYQDAFDPGRAALSWAYRSFMAGWADADQGIRSEDANAL